MADSIQSTGALTGYLLNLKEETLVLCFCVVMGLITWLNATIAGQQINHGFKSHCNSLVDASADIRMHEWFDIKSLSLQSLTCKHLHIRKETDCVDIDVVLVHGGKRCSYLHLCRAKPGQCSPQVTQGCPLCGSSAGFSL